MVLCDHGDVGSRLEIGRRDRHCEADAFAAFDGAMYGHDVQQIADHDLGTEGAQSRGSLVVDSYMRPYPEPPSEKQLRDRAAHRADSSGRAGHENRKFMVCRLLL